MTAKCDWPSLTVSAPDATPTSATIFSVVADEPVFARNTTWTAVCWAIAALVDVSTEPLVTVDP
jgi:hypothetical protein